jgi:hypothetical protein
MTGQRAQGTGHRGGRREEGITRAAGTGQRAQVRNELTLAIDPFQKHVESPQAPDLCLVPLALPGALCPMSSALTGFFQ